MQQRNHTFADKEEHADRAAATFCVGDMAVTAAELAIALAAHSLRAEDVATQ